MTPKSNPTPARQLSKTPGNFQPGEYTLIGLIADRYDEAAHYYVEMLEDMIERGPTNEEADHFFPIVSKTVRRMIHYGLMCTEGEALQQEMTYEAVQDCRFAWLQLQAVPLEEITEALSGLGRRHMWSRVFEGRIT